MIWPLQLHAMGVSLCMLSYPKIVQRGETQSGGATKP